MKWFSIFRYFKISIIGSLVAQLIFSFKGGGADLLLIWNCTVVHNGYIMSGISPGEWIVEIVGIPISLQIV